MIPTGAFPYTVFDILLNRTLFRTLTLMRQKEHLNCFVFGGDIIMTVHHITFIFLGDFGAVAPVMNIPPGMSRPISSSGAGSRPPGLDAIHPARPASNPGPSSSPGPSDRPAASSFGPSCDRTPHMSFGPASRPASIPPGLSAGPEPSARLPEGPRVSLNNGLPVAAAGNGAIPRPADDAAAGTLALPPVQEK